MTATAQAQQSKHEQQQLDNVTLIVPCTERAGDWLELAQRHASNVTVVVLDGDTDPDRVDLDETDCLLVDGRLWGDEAVMNRAIELLLRATAYRCPNPIAVVTDEEAALRRERYVRHWTIQCIPVDRYATWRIAHFLEAVLPLHSR